MKAVICEKYGSPDGLVQREISEPKIRDHDVLIKIYATSAHIGDTRIRRVDPFLVRFIFGLFKPKKNLILGLEISGVVSAIGQSVTKFKPGDEVFALTGFGLGGYAEYISLPEKVKDGTQERKGLIAIKPKNLSFEEAATVPAACLTVLMNLKKANISEGKEILIYGASGSLGTYSIQLARYFGAKVTAVCSSKNMDIVKELGADDVIDYTITDVYKLKQKYDIVYDTVMKLNKRKSRSLLKENGIFLNNSGLPTIVDRDLDYIKKLIEEKHLKPVIDRIYSIDEVREAHSYVDKGHKIGNVAITVVNVDKIKKSV